MSLTTVVVGIVLIFLLFTEAGRKIGLLLIALLCVGGLAVIAHGPLKTAREVVGITDPDARPVQANPPAPHVNESASHDAAHPYVSLEAFCLDHGRDEPKVLCPQNGK